MTTHKPELPHGKRKWLTSQVFGFGLTSFFSDLSHEVATTLLPLFMASVGAPAYAVGLIEGLADGVASVGKLVGGWFSDQKSKRKFLGFIGYAVTGVTQGMYAFVTIWPQALVLRATGWMGRGWRSPIRDALFHDSVLKVNSGKAFGFERMMDTLGAVLAPLCAYFLLPTLGFKNIFMLTWIPGILAAIVFYALIKDHRVHHPKKFSFSQGIKSFSPSYRVFLVAVTLFGLADFSHAILIFWAGKLLAVEHGFAKASSMAILLYVFHNAVYALTSYPAGHIADKIGKFRVLAFAYALAAVMFIALIFVRESYLTLLVIFLIRGFYMAIQNTLERAIAGDLLAQEIKGTGYGVLASMNGIGDLLSSFIVGILLSTGSSALAFGYCALFATLGTVALFQIRKVPRHA